MTQRTKEEIARWNYLSNRLGKIRVYLFDIDSGKEITLKGNHSGLACFGVGENGIIRDKRIRETTVNIEIADFSNKTIRNITSSDFTGKRVVAYIWVPCEEYREWRALVDLNKGWKGNEALKEVKTVSTIHHPVIEAAIEKAKQIRAKK